MAITATVAAVAGTAYVADKMGDAAKAQKSAAEQASRFAGTQAQAINDQTEVLRQQLDQQRRQMDVMVQNNNSLLTQQQSQFDAGFRAQQESFNTLLTQQQGQFAASQAATQAAFEQTLARQREEAAAQAQLAEEARNRANQKKPASEGFITKNERAGMTGQASTLLTGTQGVTSASLPLGKATLLGG